MKRRLSFGALCLAAGVAAGGALPALTAHANSAQSFWSGRDSFGAYVKEENCPVTVAGEKLTLRIPDFPSNYYQELEDFLAYTANVTAEYTFYNPASYDVEMTLVFPFGRQLGYLYDIYDEEGNRVAADDTAGYLITSDGEEVERTVRHTLDRWTSDPSKDIPRLAETKRTSGNFSAETPVTVYYYRQVSTENTSKSSFIAASFKGLGDGAKTKVLLERLSGSGEGAESIGLWGDNYSEPSPFALYVIGEPLSKMPEWKVYETAACKKLTEGYVERVPEEKLPTGHTTLGELLMGKYDEKYGVGETDWFNAAFDALLEGETGLTLKKSPRELDVSERLMRWYEYRLSVPAGGRVVNSVTAPLYPAIDIDFTPTVYSYTYLLSPASTWADFGTFELNIETPYFITEGSLQFEKGEGGYTYSRQGLPEGELTFTMSTVESPVRISHAGEFAAFFFTYFWWLLVIPAALIAAAVVAIVLAVKRKRRKDREKS